MAAPANTQIRFTLSLVDNDNVRANTDVYAQYPTTITLAQLWVDLQTLTADALACSDAGLVKAQAAVVPTVGDLGFSATPSGEEDVSDCGELQFFVNSSDKTWSYVIPALMDSLTSGGRMVTTALGPIDTLTTFLITPPHTGAFFANPNILEIGPRKATFLGDRKHRKKLHSGSYVLG